jgi:hypothetical protein
VTEFNDLAQRYVAMWNESDTDRRRTAIVELFDVDGRHADQFLDVSGHTEIEKVVAEAHQQFVVDGGFGFRSAGNADGFGNVVRFNWEMVPSGADEPVAIGFDFLILDTDGKIAVDYQFMEMVATES